MLGRGKGLPESFSVYVQYLISGCLDPDFVTSLSSKDSTCPYRTSLVS